MLLVIVAVMVTLAATAVPAQASSNVHTLSNKQLAKEARKVIAKGGISSYRWGDASPYLKSICYEMLERAFKPYGTHQWARYIVNRESGCNPGAINKKYSNPSQQASGLAQLIPAIHTWVNYPRMLRDLKYGVAVFLRLSRGGSHTSPWSCC